MTRFFIFTFIVLLTACVTPPAKEDAKLVLRPAGFSDLPGWGSGDMQGAKLALQRSCVRIMKADPAKNFGSLPEAGAYALWQKLCAELENTVDLRSFFESNFRPYAATAEGNPEGLFTGYYEASLKGSLTKHGPYNVPLYARPDDLVMVDLGEFREELKGQRIAGRVRDGNLKPYETRELIVAGQWPHNDKVLVWVDDAVDAFYVQIQGSGIVNLDDGSTLRIGYAGQNGWPYYAIGRELVKRGHLSKENVSMQAIRNWLAAHPSEADEIMNTNKSYVFFKVLEEEGPVGGEGVALTPGHSLAIDRSKIPYGIPVWTDIEYEGGLRQLMVAQDTGGAIRGAVRGDVFWGYGPGAEELAGPMKAKGRYWLLLPKAAY
ncbi:MAG: murein transglycosylase A [Alphaproteobacteria bacterium]|nr:murein transglycosylase A [Alphaproteobacteria bacterium]